MFSLSQNPVQISSLRGVLGKGRPERPRDPRIQGHHEELNVIFMIYKLCYETVPVA